MERSFRCSETCDEHEQQLQQKRQGRADGKNGQRNARDDEQEGHDVCRNAGEPAPGRNGDG